MILINLLPSAAPKSPWATSQSKDCEHFHLGVLERDNNGQCRICTRAYKRRWNRANKEYGRQWRTESADELKVKKKAHYDENAEYYREKSRTWNAANPERKAATGKAYKRTNPEAWRKSSGMVFAEGHTVAQIREAQRDRCAICDCVLSELPPRQVHVDHDHAIVDGSPNVRGILCHRHNHLLGNAGDSTEILERAIAYLKRGVL